MKQRYSNDPLRLVKRNTDRGVVIIFSAIVIVSLLIVMSLAVDAGNLFLAKQRLQHATDAATIKALSIVGQQISDQDVIDIAEQLAVDNLQKNVPRMNLNTWNPATAITAQIVSTSPTKIQVNGTLDVGTFFMGRLINVQNSHQLTTTSVGIRNQLIVSLVLDHSGSMRCPADTSIPCKGTLPDGSPYFCEDTPDLALCRPLRIDELKSAILDFLDFFKEGTDQISVVTFNSTAEILQPIDASFADIRTSIMILDENPTGGTNIADSILKGTQEVLNSSIPMEYAQRVMILISDGAPNAGSTICTDETDRAGIYLRTIQASDAARSNDIIVHVIGLGSDNGIVNDPYQDLTDGISLKPILLRRIANNIAGKQDVEFSDTCVPSYSSISNDKMGLYLETPNASELETLLNTIGRGLKPRLTQ